jgi:hypothetical protein
MSTQGQINLTPEALQAMIASAVAAAITESRKPAPPTEQELAAIQMKQEHRAKQSQHVIDKMKNERAIRMICSHTHAQREGGGTHCVWVREEDPRSPGFILCQLNQCRIRPGDFDKEGLPFQRDRGAIYSTEQFNKLFQDCGPTGLMG